MIPLPPQHYWSEQIFGCANLGDKCRTKRRVKVTGDLSAHTGSSLATSCSGNLAAVEGAYRLIENEAVEPDAIAEAGFQTTEVAQTIINLPLPKWVAGVIQNALAYLGGWSYGKAGQNCKTASTPTE